ncbi:MAG TPA: DNA methyltransferase [Polyangiales bacterium]|nr:DNA methyltransferase [Polyangiales bacterium]
MSFASAIELYCGRYQDVLAHVAVVDCVITDPPYGKDTHAGADDGVAGDALPDGSTRIAIEYDFWTPADVEAFVDFWAPRTRGWFACMTSDDLVPAYKAAYRAAGLYAFAPVSIIQPRPRMLGDGPGSWTVHMCVARPRTKEFASWGSRPGSYPSYCDKTGICAGAKPLSTMREIVRDYSRPGELVCDPCAGGGTGLLAAAIEGRRALGSERDPDRYAKALQRFAGEYQKVPTGQQSLFGESR